MSRMMGSQSHGYLSSAGCEQAVQPPPPPAPPANRPSRQSSNVSIAPERRSVPKRKIQLKPSGSFRIPRVSSSSNSDNESILGGRTYDTAPCPPKRNNSSTYRAAEIGKGELLPTANRPSPPTRNRSRTFSDHAWGPARGVLSRTESITRSLRSRGKRSSSTEDHTTTSVDSETASRHQPNPLQATYSFSNTHDKPPQRSYPEKSIIPHMKNGNFLQMLAVLALTCLVWESYHRAIATTEQFERLKYEESMMMLHLKRIEQQSIQVHENLGRLNDGSTLTAGNASQGKVDTEPVDSKLIHAQTQQLYQMEEELNHELRGLQAKLQLVARKSIVKAFGEGALQVTIDLDLGEPKVLEPLTISLWYDTPYAAWMLIEQVKKGLWTGSRFQFDKSLSLSAVPSNPQDMERLDFVEKSQKTHEVWTVGLAEHEAGGMSLFINLQDNTASRKHDVCIGKITGGFGTLQKLVEKTRELEGKDDSVSIRQINVSRKMAKKKEGIFE